MSNDHYISNQTSIAPLQIERIVRDTNDMISRIQNPDKRILAIGIEINQRYAEYLDDLLSTDLSESNGITVQVDDKVLHFEKHDAFTNWLSENME